MATSTKYSKEIKAISAVLNTGIVESYIDYLNPGKTASGKEKSRVGKAFSLAGKAFRLAFTKPKSLYNLVQIVRNKDILADKEFQIAILETPIVSEFTQNLVKNRLGSIQQILSKRNITAFSPGNILDEKGIQIIHKMFANPQSLEAIKDIGVKLLNGEIPYNREQPLKNLEILLEKSFQDSRITNFIKSNNQNIVELISHYIDSTPKFKKQLDDLNITNDQLKLVEKALLNPNIAYELVKQLNIENNTKGIADILIKSIVPNDPKQLESLNNAKISNVYIPELSNEIVSQLRGGMLINLITRYSEQNYQALNNAYIKSVENNLPESEIAEKKLALESSLQKKMAHLEIRPNQIQQISDVFATFLDKPEQLGKIWNDFSKGDFSSMAKSLITSLHNNQELQILVNENSQIFTKLTSEFLKVDISNEAGQKLVQGLFNVAVNLPPDRAAGLVSAITEKDYLSAVKNICETVSSSPKLQDYLQKHPQEFNQFVGAIANKAPNLANLLGPSQLGNMANLALQNAQGFADIIDHYQQSNYIDLAKDMAKGAVATASGVIYNPLARQAAMDAAKAVYNVATGPIAKEKAAEVKVLVYTKAAQASTYLTSAANQYASAALAIAGRGVRAAYNNYRTNPKIVEPNEDKPELIKLDEVNLSDIKFEVAEHREINTIKEKIVESASQITEPLIKEKNELQVQDQISKEMLETSQTTFKEVTTQLPISNNQNAEQNIIAQKPLEQLTTEKGPILNELPLVEVKENLVDQTAKLSFNDEFVRAIADVIVTKVKLDERSTKLVQNLIEDIISQNPKIDYNDILESQEAKGDLEANFEIQLNDMADSIYSQTKRYWTGSLYLPQKNCTPTLKENLTTPLNAIVSEMVEARMWQKKEIGMLSKLNVSKANDPISCEVIKAESKVIAQAAVSHVTEVGEYTTLKAKTLSKNSEVSRS